MNVVIVLLAAAATAVAKMSIEHVTLETVREIMKANPRRFYGIYDDINLAHTKYTVALDEPVVLCTCWRLVAHRLSTSPPCSIEYAKCANA